MKAPKGGFTHEEQERSVAIMKRRGYSHMENSVHGTEMARIVDNKFMAKVVVTRSGDVKRYAETIATKREHELLRK